MKKIAILAFALLFSGCVVLEEQKITPKEEKGKITFLDENLKQAQISFNTRKKLPKKLNIDTQLGFVNINGKEFGIFYLRGDDENKILTRTLFDDKGQGIQISSSLGISVAGELGQFSIYEYYKSKKEFQISAYKYLAKEPICKAYKSGEVQVVSVENHYFGSNDFIAAIANFALNSKGGSIKSVDFKDFSKQNPAFVSKFAQAFKDKIAAANLQKHKAILENYICFNQN